MAAVTTIERRQIESTLPATRARIGMIIPSVNSMTEPQFNHFAPPGLGVHIARARVAGEWKRPLAAMADEIATSAKLLADVALGLRSLEFAAVTPREWAELARKHDRADVDGIFLSCTNTTQIEAIEEIEDELGKPVVNSNQAVLWGCVKRLKSSLAPLPPMPRLGRLLQRMDV